MNVVKQGLISSHFGAPRFVLISSGCTCRVASWFCFQTENTNLNEFWRVLQWKMLAHFIGHLDYFTSIWYILWSFGIFFHVLVPRKNLAALVAALLQKHRRQKETIFLPILIRTHG
jgi:hypothetical protein